MTSFDNRSKGRVSSIESQHKSSTSKKMYENEKKKKVSNLDRILDQKIQLMSKELKKVVQEIGLKE